MTVDLKQPVSLKGVASKGKKASYPTKTTINLVDAGAARGSLAVQVALFLVVLALIGIFAKFAVVDPLATSLASSSNVAAAQERLDELKAANADYAQLNQTYARYVATGLTEDEQNLARRDTVLDLLRSKVMGVGYLQSLKVEGNVATVSCLGVDLTKVSALVESLEADSQVAHVTVSTAQSEASAAASATIEITFKGALDQAGAGDGATGVSAGTGAGK